MGEVYSVYSAEEFKGVAVGLPRSRYLIPFSAVLKQNMTQAERHLWFRFLREYETPFRQQKIIGPYIVDFFCNKARISIELDGSQHYEPTGIARDRTRTDFLEMLEIKELRFPNSDIYENFEGVCTVIDREVKRRRNDISYIPLSSVKLKR